MASPPLPRTAKAWGDARPWARIALARILSPGRWLQTGLVVVLAALFAPAMVEMAHVWWTDAYAGHGMFVPLFCALVAWTDRERLRAAAGPGHPAGLVVVLAGLGLLGLGSVYASPLVKGSSVAVVVAGLVVWSVGPRCLRAAAFPVGFLLAMAPLPRAVVAVVTLKIQLFAAAFAAAVLRSIDVPVHQTGVAIELPTLTLQVAEACNGLRFLAALLVLTTAFAQLTQRDLGRKVALVASAIPIAILANATRVAAIALGVHFVGPQAASGTLHNMIGKGVWALTLIPLIGLGLLLARAGTPKASPAGERPA